MPTSKSTAKSTSSTHAKKPAGSHAHGHPKSDAAPDAIELLTQDHQEVKKLFKAYDKLVKAQASADDKQNLANQICAMLTVHTTIEEELFYPAAREALSEQDLLDEATVEHASAKDLIAQIQSMSASDDLYDAKVTVLGEYIDHHVKEEETEMFPKVKRAKVDVAQLGDEMSARKDELSAEAADPSLH
ncbi:MAG: hemerythrin domain-containing protein [Aquabacterium sp.]